MQTILVERIARAAWRLRRADQIEAQLFDLHLDTYGDLGMAVIRDGNGTRAFETLLRYRAAADGQLLRALRTLKALQAEALQAAAAAAPATAPMPKEPKARADAGSAGHDARPDPIDHDLASKAAPAPVALAPGERPIEPDARGNPGEIAPAPPADEPRAAAQPPVQPDPARTAPQASRARPIEPETREIPAKRPSGRAPEPVADAVISIRHGGR
ncbi:MAG: hypothetical protein ACREIR_04170 [Geminicoccaceae bacterium]